MAKQKIMIVDDEKDIRDLLSDAFTFRGYAVETAKDGEDALIKMKAFKPHILILDIMMPKLSGFGVARELRLRNNLVPIIFLSAKDDTEDKISGLSAGGDDYVTKPFSIEELAARVKAIMNRSYEEIDDSEVISTGGLSLNEASHDVHLDGKLIKLSPTEYNLLHLLMSNMGRVVTTEKILENIWDQEWEGGPVIVQSYISYLRKKIQRKGKPSLIENKRGFGYIIKDED